jgi:hypothetical protein
MESSDLLPFYLDALLGNTDHQVQDLGHGVYQHIFTPTQLTCENVGELLLTLDAPISLHPWTFMISEERYQRLLHLYYQGIKARAAQKRKRRKLRAAFRRKKRGLA